MVGVLGKISKSLGKGIVVVDIGGRLPRQHNTYWLE